MRLGILSAALCLVACTSWLAARRAAPSLPPGPRAPVIVELFSSEGCSSCPSADAYLSALDRAQPIDGVTVIALEEHVDYWDRLGWRDPFGSPTYSARQNEYARALPDHHVFTPEIVFDGHLVMPGGDEEAARTMMQASAREPKTKVLLVRDGARVTIDVTGVPAFALDDPPELYLAVTESGLATDVPSGENAGRHLVHAPVVRRLRSLGRVTGGAFHTVASFDTEPAWRPGALRLVAFVQLASSRRIVGAGTS